MSRLLLLFSLLSLAVSPLLSAIFWLTAFFAPIPQAEQRQTPQASKTALKKYGLYLGIAWLSLSCLTGIFSKHPLWHISGIIARYGLPALIFWMTYRALKQRRFQSQEIFNGLIAASLLLALFGLGNHLLGWEFSQNQLCFSGFDSSCLLNLNLDKSDRAQALAMHPNTLGTLLCLSLPLWLWQINAARGLLKLPVFLGLAPILLCLLMTYSRAAWLAAIAIVIISSFYLLNASWRLILWAALSLGLLPLLFKVSSLGERLLSLFKPTEGSSGTRLVIWQTGWKILQDKPFLGTGLLHVEEYYALYRPQPIEAAHLHNFYLQIAVESGVPAALLIFGLLFYLLRSPQKLSKIGQAAWFSYLCLGLISWADCTILDLRVVWFMMVLLAVIVFERRLMRQAKQVEQMLGSEHGIKAPKPFINPDLL